MKAKITIVKCPQCGASVEWTENSPFRPFCSKKCQMIDFGTWANEENSIPGAPDLSDSDRWSEDEH
ncbi:DNA gyrase inhibitor YacG [Vibrio salinus]|uniref:DNA gyrase inhibitor YacG n=1 Tax=Vibrio salinus TaxID=2899784 RepID=UPI001E2CBFBE|nr:DNA gyrase inhibitor YacG [Vibrio salinus]MCE0493382.1 DNA gyrase inhibitor YacG [Vibrio salinus]